MTTLYSFHNLKIDGKNFSVEVRFDPTHPVFAGHFPGKPVVPGVILVEILEKAASKIVNRKLLIIEASNLKFMHVIDPGFHGTVTLIGSIVKENEGIYRMDATFILGELLFAKIKSLKFKA